jgi:3-hydroxyacyl-CoA dehydrogenase
MENTIKTVAVLGSGVMGSGIAALLANAGCNVHLLDIVPKDTQDRSALAKGAIDKQLKANPSGFTHPSNAKRITAGNLEDDAARLADCDWIIEVVLEDLSVKQKTYHLIDTHRKQGSIVSSNTSTLPLHVLIKDMPEHFQRDFMITHFFNPPRFLPLLEVTGGTTCDPKHVDAIAEFADKRLGKGVVRCKDTAGFLANRIGIFWMLVGLLEAIESGISVEEADAVMSRPVGIPKTALFGLYDLIGIDLMPLIAKAMLATLPKTDRFHALYREPDLIKTMIFEGYTGRKGKGGFYKMDNLHGKKTKMVKDLRTGEYHPTTSPMPESALAAKAGLAALVNHPDKAGQFARKVLIHTLHYAVSLVPEISDDILNIDAAMRLGFAWKYGPFELIDRLGTPTQTGTDWLKDACEKEGLPVPPLLEKAAGKTFYNIEGNTRYYLGVDGGYHAQKVPTDAYMLADVTRGQKPVLKNHAAQLWDSGDGIAMLEFTTKMNTIDDGVIEMINRAIDKVQSEFHGLVIATDAEKFSLGANLPFFMFLANVADWQNISNVIKAGQDTMMRLKYAPFPVVASLSGMALGGGCELTLHCDAVQAHMESYQGLVEVGVGVIPAWGGCKELLLRTQHVQTLGKIPQGAMPVLAQAFETIMLAKVAGSAQEAQELLFLNEKSRISMNRQRVLPDAKALCASLAKEYAPPSPPQLHLAGESGKVAMLMALDGFKATGKATPHDVVIGTHLAEVLSGGNTDYSIPLTEQDVLDLEREHFIELVKTKATRARIEHMLEHNKPLRN